VRSGAEARPVAEVRVVGLAGADLVEVRVVGLTGADSVGARVAGFVAVDLVEKAEEKGGKAELAAGKTNHCCQNRPPSKRRGPHL
jgi:hypothetical protein